MSENNQKTKSFLLLYIATPFAAFVLAWFSVEDFMDFMIRNPVAVQRLTNGPWSTRLDLGRPDQKALVRAFVARIGLGANRAEETIYWATLQDSKGRPLNSAYSYRVHFPRPLPVDGFWSMTLYQEDNFLYPNPDKIYALGDRSNLQKNPDGSFDILVSSTRPAAGKRNWLPAPGSSQVFNLTLRCYFPREEMIKNAAKIKMPRIIRLGGES